MAAKPKEPDLAILSDLAVHAQKLLQQFIDVPFTEPERATELLNEFDQAVEQFKLLSAKVPTRKGRVLQIADAPKPRRCPICKQRIVRGRQDHIEIGDATYHQSCRDAAGSRRSGQSRG